MKKRIITNEQNETLAWFDESKAIKVEEDFTFDGRNQISKATGGQWDHEALFLTASGKWVLNAWSNWQGSNDTYRFVSDAKAYAWIMVNASPSEIESLRPLQKVAFDMFLKSSEV
jgi:hypothetical protein